MLETAVWGAAGDDAEDDVPQRKGRRGARRAPPASPAIGLAEAAVVLGIPPQGSGWRRRVLRRLRALERQTGAPLCVARRGRGGTVVSLEVLRRACPLAFAGLDELTELRAKVQALEARVAAAEGALRLENVELGLDIGRKKSALGR
jgi:hypothetical protein